MLSWQRAVIAVLATLTLVTVPGALATTGDFPISTGGSTRPSSGHDTAFGFQIGLDAAAGIVHAAWADNSRTLAGNPDPPNTDIAVARIDSAAPGASPNINLNAAPGQPAGTVDCRRPH